ncbi:MAG: tRNA 2-thiouridine(34) synthase MnmA [Prevotellaceae bacterium]|nr:tRNA 2-thiouridine(34) synthase MnmA [Prevotellaceae bacterium]
MTIAALLSGGVDSAVAVHLLCEQGLRPDLFYIRIVGEDETGLTCTAEEDLELCTAVARRYGLALDVVDLSREYRENVVAYVVDKARRGLTPNPDVMCNRLIKFGCFEQRVGRHYDRTATGHYARRLERDGLVWMGTAADPLKDQTDFLAQIDYMQLSHLEFPIGSLPKREVRRLAAVYRLPNALRRDSQGICFLGKIGWNDFIRRYLGEKPGDVVELETGRRVGRHRGCWFHTIGQRKGLGLGGGPWFVMEKDMEENVIYVSHGYDTRRQYGTAFDMQGFHFVTADPWKDDGPVGVSFKIRHTEGFFRGRLTRRDDGRIHIESAVPLQGIAPGQFGVIYDEAAEICIGSGEITKG